MLVLAIAGFIAVPVGIIAWWSRVLRWPGHLRAADVKWRDLPDTTLAYEPARHVDAEKLARAAQLAIEQLSHVWPLAGVQIALVGWGIRVADDAHCVSKSPMVIIVPANLEDLCSELASVCERVIDRRPSHARVDWLAAGIASAENRYREGLRLL